MSQTMKVNMVSLINQNMMILILMLLSIKAMSQMMKLYVVSSTSQNVIFPILTLSLIKAMLQKHLFHSLPVSMVLLINRNVMILHDNCSQISYFMYSYLGSISKQICMYGMYYVKCFISILLKPYIKEKNFLHIDY